MLRLFVAFRWVINIVLIAFPWVIWSAVNVIVNIVMNAWLNKWWAKGNFWLLFNTAFGMLQCVLSWPLFFEFGLYMRHLWFMRWWSIFAATVYNTIYFGLLFGWIIQTYTLPEQEMEEVGTIDILLNMFFLYNTIIHAPMALINIGIIIKEIELQFYQISRGTEGSDYNLSFKKAEEKFNKNLWFMNPVMVFQRAWYAIFRWHIEDIWSYKSAEKEGEEDKFISNWGKK